MSRVETIRSERFILGDPSTGERVYLVEINAGQDADAALSAPGLPRVDQSWSLARPSVTVQNIECDLVDSTTVRVRVNYSEPSEGATTTQAVNPINLPSRISIRSFSGQETYFIDANDQAVVNTAGYPFAQLPMRDVAEGWQFVITKEISPNSVGNFGPLIKSLNSNAISIDGQGVSRGLGRIEDIQIGPVTTTLISTGTVEHRTLTTTITRRASWDDRFESRGFNQADGTVIQDEHGQPVRDPFPLDSAGNRLGSAGGTPAVVTRIPYVQRNWPSILFT